MIEAIQTEYKGYRFRSRLEARWAVFFDACGADWEYEPEGYDLDNGLYYLPDFLIRNAYINNGKTLQCMFPPLYVEVKGQMTDNDADKIWKFAISGINRDGNIEVAHPTLVVGKIPDGEHLKDIIDYIKKCTQNNAYGRVREFFSSTVNTYCDAIVPCISRSGLFMLTYANSVAIMDLVNFEATEKAYKLARQARFEHGETPQNVKPMPLT